MSQARQFLTVSSTTTLADIGTHTVTLRVSDGALFTEQTLEIPVNAPPTLSADLSVLDRSLYLGDTAAVAVRSSGGYRSTTRQLFINESPVTLDGNGDYTFTAATAGQYRLRAVVTDEAGVSVIREDSVVVKILGDVLPPAISFALPADGASVTAPTDIVGTISDANLLGYTVDLRRAGDGAWQTIATGSSNIQDGVLGRQ